MLRVEKIKKPVYGFRNYPNNTRIELITKFGCDGVKGNFVIEGEYTEELIKKIRDFISQEDGILRVYKMWYSESIKKWRLIFGYE